MQKMYFPKDMYYEDLNVPLYHKDKTYDIEDRMVWRWQKRGAVLVKDMPKKDEPMKAKEPVVETDEKPEDKPKVEVKPVVSKSNKK